MEAVSIAAGLVSLILSILAIWMSIHFYTQTKDTEKNVQLALEGIKAQTAALQTLNAKTLDRLTKYVTTPRDDSTQAVQLVYGTIREISAIMPRPSAPDSNLGAEALRAKLNIAYVILWHYTAKANAWAAMMLPPAEQFDQTNRFHQLVRTVLDSSNNDFRYVGGFVSQIDVEEIAGMPCLVAYQETQDILTPIVGDTAFHFARLAQQANEPDQGQQEPAESPAE